MTTSDDNRSRWLAHLLSTEAADRPRAEGAMRDIYAAAGFSPPHHALWFDSPFDACWANALLTAPHSFIWQRLLAGFGQVKAYREIVSRKTARSVLYE